MALGTETIGKVHMLPGPGNADVAEVERELCDEVGIDLVAGPTEILVMADEFADPLVVAVDLLSQAEHRPDSPAILITMGEALARSVIALATTFSLKCPPRMRRGGAAGSRRSARRRDREAWFALADSSASERVEVLTRDPRRALGVMRNYEAHCLGAGTCVSYGDKVIGTSLTLPTRGAAR